jgi:HAD superfamily hydrolase (TIGR01549 family)
MLRPSESRWIALDVGETLINETRVWSVWADLLGVSRLTLFAALGAEIADGGDHQTSFERVGVPDWRERLEEAETIYGGFRADDLYPDALPAVNALCQAGYRVAIIANQPARRTPELRALGFEPDVMAMSGEMEVHKPDPRFFARALELMGNPHPADVAYIGDRVDNDVIPAVEAGMHAIWIRRGPWGTIQSLPEALAGQVTVLESLDELLPALDAIWR